MGLVFLLGILFIALFISIINMIYRKIECKNYSEWRKSSVFNSYTAWKLYAIGIAIAIVVVYIIAFTNILVGFSNIGKQQDTITQQQQDTSDQQEDTSTQQQNNSTK